MVDQRLEESVQQSYTELQDHHERALASERLARLICADLVRRPPETLDDGVLQALERVGQFCSADRCYVFLLRPGGLLWDNTLEWCAPGVEPRKHHLQARPTAQTPWWMDQLRRLEPIIIPDVAALPPEAALEREVLEAQDIRSLVAVPLLAPETLLGFIGFDWVREGVTSLHRAATVLEMVSNAIGHAIHRGRVERELREAKALSEALNRVNAAVRATFDLDEMMAAAVPECSRALQADAAAVIHRRGDAWAIVYASPEGASFVGEPASWARLLAASGRPLLIEDTEGEAPASPDHVAWLRRAGYRACLSVPLLGNSELRGALCFGYRHPTTLSEAQRDFAAHLSASISMAMESARLYQSEFWNHRFLRSVTDTIPVGMVVLDSETLRIKWINPAGLNLLEEPYRSRAKPGAVLSDLVPHSQAEALARVAQRVLATGQPYVDEEALLTAADGTKTYWWLTIMPYASPDCSRDILIVASEMTEQVRTRSQVEELVASLEEERDLLQAIMDNTDTYLAYLNSDFELVRVNANFAEGLGVTPEELVGRCFFDVLPDLEVRRIFEWGRDAGLPVRFHERGFSFPRAKRYGPGYWDWSLVPIKNSQGHVQGLVLCLVDVTPFVLTRSRIEALVAETQRWAAELDEERARLKAVIESAPEAIVVCDREGRVQMGNAMAERICAHHLGENDPEQCSEEAPLVCDSDLHPCPASELPLVRSARYGQVCSAQDLVLLWADGRRRDLRASSAPILDREGRITGAVGIYQDVTDIKAAERERAQLQEMKSEFVASVSHELRTPLASIKGYTELLLDGGAGALNPLQREFLGTVFESGEQLEWLIDDLLDVSRLEANRFGMELARVRAEELVRAAVTRIRPLTDELVVELKVETEPNLPEVRGDPRRLEQVLNNLLSNAVKFTPPGGKITVSARKAGDEGLEIAVSDTGVGIPAEDLPHLFERFYRAHNVAESAASGTGLGLYISRAIVDMHGGTIAVESELHRGSTFRVWLPTITNRTGGPRI
jgi:PAS domain S-box-containing protein